MPPDEDAKGTPFLSPDHGIGGNRNPGAGDRVMQAEVQIVCDHLPAAIRRIVEDDHTPRQTDMVDA